MPLKKSTVLVYHLFRLFGMFMNSGASSGIFGDVRGGGYHHDKEGDCQIIDPILLPEIINQPTNNVPGAVPFVDYVWSFNYESADPAVGLGPNPLPIPVRVKQWTPNLFSASFRPVAPVTSNVVTGPPGSNADFFIEVSADFPTSQLPTVLYWGGDVGGPYGTNLSVGSVDAESQLFYLDPSIDPYNAPLPRFYLRSFENNAIVSMSTATIGRGSPYWWRSGR